ncbi:MAG TPA: hypothetical protein PLZ36_12740 [Armatimonadota bacterium]|nr:hypothetical protein [Armatimonadota bacterium]
MEFWQWVWGVLGLLWLWAQAHPEAAVGILVFLVAKLPLQNVYLAWLAKQAVMFAQQWAMVQEKNGKKPTNQQILGKAFDFVQARGIRVPDSLRCLIEAKVWEVKRIEGWWGK